MTEVPQLDDDHDLQPPHRGDALLSAYSGFFYAPDVTPKQMHEALPGFAIVLSKSASGDYGDYSQTATVKDLVRSFLRTAGRCISEDPSLVQPCIDLYTELSSARQTTDETYYWGSASYDTTYRTSAAKFVDDTVDVIKFLGNRNYATREGYSNEHVESLCRLASGLADKKIIHENFWYRYGVRKLRGPASFGFVEALHHQIDQAEADFLPEGGRHAEYYRDAYRLVMNTIDGLALDSTRNTQNVEAVARLIREELYLQVPTLGSIVTAANKISGLINKAQLIKDEDSVPVELEPLDVHSFSELPAAFTRLLYITRDFRASEEDKDRQAYQDGVCIEVLSWLVSAASERHEAWYINRVLRSTGDLRIIEPKLKRADIEELRAVGGRYRPSYWSKWNRGYGKLS